MTETTPREQPRDFASMADRTSADERELIVAWLRKEATADWVCYPPDILEVADRIERGEHGN